MNLICIPFAYDANKNSGKNIDTKLDIEELYIKCSIVSLISAKTNNPDSEVAFATNINLKEDLIALLNKHNIKVLHIDYDCFLFPSNYPWSLAFYKLCVMKHILDLGIYSKTIFIDCDTFCQLPATSIWEECNEKILISDTQEALSNKNYSRFRTEAINFGTIDKYLTHYCGCFIAFNNDNGKIFIDKCFEIYNKMIKQKFITYTGDEFIISLSSTYFPNLVKTGNMYCQTFWTGVFRMMSSRYLFNPVIFLHCPNEKKHGFETIFRKYKKYKGIPNKLAHRYLHLTHKSLATLIKPFFGLFIKKYKKYYLE